MNAFPDIPEAESRRVARCLRVVEAIQRGAQDQVNELINAAQPPAWSSVYEIHFRFVWVHTRACCVHRTCLRNQDDTARIAIGGRTTFSIDGARQAVNTVLRFVNKYLLL